ncbi:hypothetical protein [Paenibacillus sp. UNC499MF]|uniref:hypothetical protein n=1 Tax=Paenibacillus sp. UNC499MF TaxID=1502751 RepID=UPI0008A07749|nr:hypothetical protein [Paenibacillus sp. UNC499MF]SEF53678.1 hypothetical protein SAMN02799616_00400 [Paenibacillus sp. UNC499MF]
MKLLCVGAKEHSDLLLGICRVAAVAGRRVLLIDGTASRRLSCLVAPGPEPELVQYDEIDVACYFSRMCEALEHASASGAVLQDYDLVMVDTDRADFLGKECTYPFEGFFLTTAYDKYTMRRTEELIRSLNEACQINTLTSTVIIRDAVECGIDEEYVDKVLAPLPLITPDEYYKLPFDEVDLAVRIESEYQGKIGIRRMSRTYRNVLLAITNEITGEDKVVLKRTIKQAMRRKTG